MKPTLGLLGLTLALNGAAQAQDPALDTQRIDALFAAYDDKGPGCALGVFRHGRLAYAKGYGLADLSHGVPIRPETVFDIGSTSKQFTALALLLLERDGKLSLDDRLDRHLPELAGGYAAALTLRQLLQHSAGLPDYTELLQLAGKALEDLTDDADALRALKAVRQLNFKPGSRFAYSNSGYFLASQVAERVSGGKLDALLQQRVFKPLGMTATHVRTDQTQVVAHRASSYVPTPEGPMELRSNWNQSGDGAVQSHVLDLGRWDAELADPKVLPAELLQALRTPGRLSDGKPMAYGLGLMVDQYRGLPRWHHGGAWAGYRAMTMHFPQQSLGLALSCNRGDADTQKLAQRVADLVLEGQFADGAPAPVQAVAAAAQVDLKPFEGRYLDRANATLLQIQPDARQPGQLEMLLGPGGAPLQALGARELQSRSGNSRLLLSADGSSLTLQRRADGSRMDFQRLAEFRPNAALAKAVAGRYRHAALGADWALQARGDALHLLARGHDPEAPLQWLAADLLAGPGYLLELQRDAKGRVSGFVFNSERSRGLGFRRG